MAFSRALYRFAYPLAAAMLIAWAYVTFAGPGWGWMHLFLTLGVALLFWRIVQRSPPQA